MTSETPDGKFTATLDDPTPDKSVSKRWLAMTQETRDLEYEEGQNNMQAPEVHEQFAEVRENKARRRGERTGFMRCKPTYRKVWPASGDPYVVRR